MREINHLCILKSLSYVCVFNVNSDREKLAKRKCQTNQADKFICYTRKLLNFVQSILSVKIRRKKRYILECYIEIKVGVMKCNNCIIEETINVYMYVQCYQNLYT